MSSTIFEPDNQQTISQNLTDKSEPPNLSIKIPDEFLQDSLLDRIKLFPLTDAGNAECFTLLHYDSMRYCKSRKKWLKWDGVKWKTDTDGEAHRAAIITARIREWAAFLLNNNDSMIASRNWAHQSEGIARRIAMLNTAMHLNPIEITIDKFDQNPFLAGVENGTLDLKTRKLIESKREDYISMQLNVLFDPFADSPRWKQFLAEIFAGDEELILFIQKAVGYLLTGDTSEQVIFICYGNGANGKSVFLDVLSRLLGDYGANCPFSTFEGNRRNDQTNDLAALKGKRSVTVIETNEDKRLDEARVKSVTGQDLITCRYLYGEYFSYKPAFKIWMAVNHKPLIRGTDKGIWRRIRLIPFTQNFEETADPNLVAKLIQELPGILNWAIEGLRLWQVERLGSAKAIDGATQEYRKESDLMQQWLDENTLVNSDAQILCTDAYQSFVLWCKDRGFPVWSNNSFGRGMSEKGFERKSDGKARYYKGLSLS